MSTSSLQPYLNDPDTRFYLVEETDDRYATMNRRHCENKAQGYIVIVLGPESPLFFPVESVYRDRQAGLITVTVVGQDPVITSERKHD